MKPLQFSGPASAELAEAIRWCERQRPGLGGELFDALVSALDSIRVHPEIGSLSADRLRSRQLKISRFPYKLVYRVREHDIYVVAIAHTSRRPDFWKDRR